MTALRRSLLISTLLVAGANAQAHDAVPWSIVPERESVPATLSDRDALGLPGLRPRLTMNLPLDSRQLEADGSPDQGAFSWSLETWQLNTASLAHIQCNSAKLTIDSYLAQDCRFVDQPLPEDSVNLVQVRGNWTAAPGLNLGVGAFHSQPEHPAAAGLHQGMYDHRADSLSPDRLPGSQLGTEGVDLNVSFGIQTERVGDFLVGLQLARYRQRMSLSDLGLPLQRSSLGGTLGTEATYYSNSAQLMLGWRRGRFSGEMLGNHRETPLWSSLDASPTPSMFNTFDLEFSWHAPRNASISIGVSNVLDTAPRADEPGADARLEDPMENIYGRIPYVRYKQDL
jgi:hypothetical protein